MPYIVRNGIVYSAGGGGSGEGVTKQTVADWGFYELPEGGIPAKDLADGVIPTIPESLPANGGHADSANSANNAENFGGNDPSHYATSASVTALSSDVDRHAFGSGSGSWNLWDEKWTNKAYNLQDGSSGIVPNAIGNVNYVKVKPSTNYYGTISAMSRDRNFAVIYYDSNGAFINSAIVSNGQFLTPSNCEYINFYWEQTDSPAVYANDFAIIEGTSGQYSPFVKSNKQLTEDAENSELRDAELQVLGWTVPKEMSIKNTLVNGVLTQKVGRVDLGSLTWNYLDVYQVFYTDEIIPPIYNDQSLGYCYKYLVTTSRFDTMGDKSISTWWEYFSTDCRAILKDLSFSNPSALKESLSNVYLYFTLPTPITYSISDTNSLKDSDTLDGKHASDFALADDVDLHAFGEQSGSKNILDTGNLRIGDYNNHTTKTRVGIDQQYKIFVKNGTTVTISQKSTLPLNLWLFFTDSANAIVYDPIIKRRVASATATANADSYLTVLFGKPDDSVILVSDVENAEVMVEYGNVAHAYEPYIKSNAMLTEESIRTAELQTLGWYVPSEMPFKNSYANGVLTQRVFRVLSDDLSWSLGSYNGNMLFDAAVPIQAVSGSKNMVFGNYIATSTYGWADLPDGYMRSYGSGLRVKDSSCSSVDEFRIKNKGKYLYFELETPITHNVTDMPSQKSMISDEWDSTKTYVVGGYAIYGNTLWKCKVQNVGQFPAENSYWTAVTVGNELGAINRDALELKTVEYTLRRGVEQGSSGAFTAALQVGRMVILNMDLKVNESIDTASTILTLPKKPTKRVYFTASDRGGQNGFAGFLGDDGTVSFYKAFGAGNYIEGQVVYFTND